jgi:putative transposase
MEVIMQPYDFTIDEYTEFYNATFPDRVKVPGIVKSILNKSNKPEQSAVIPRHKAEKPESKYTASPETEQKSDFGVEYQQPLPDKGILSADFIDLDPREALPIQFDREARLLGNFCTLVLRRLENCESKVEEWKQVTQDYNTGALVPELYQLRGNRCERALRSWIDQYRQSNRDMYALLHGNKNLNRKRKVSEIEAKILLSILLHPNRVTIGSAITLLKSQARLGRYESPTSKPTLRRWCEEWKSDNLAIWEQTRRGSKYVAEHIIKTIHRDSRLLRVGQVWVADGHTLAFDILNPKTGKAQRMTLIMVFDWASRYPVGASLAFTEDSQHIQTAFRNGFLNWGALPDCVYLDNGKAFKSKLFHEQWEEHDLERELGGIFPKLGIEAHFAESYNAKAKVIERFFKTFQEQFERFISSFRGSNIADKPATLMRNERWVKKLFESVPPTIEETMGMIGFYIRHIYGENEHGGLSNRKPWEVFSSAPLPPDRLVIPGKLNFLMLSAERKAVRSEGISFNKLQYWHPALIDYMGKPVVFRYDYGDARWIMVYDTKGSFICQAELRRLQHPFIHLDKDNPVSHKELKQEYNQVKKLQRLTEQRSKLFVKRNQESVDNLLKPYLEITPEANPTFIQPPMITAPKPGAEEELARLEQLVVGQMQEDQADLSSLETPTPDTVDLSNDQPDPFTDASFAEMLKTIGIK